MIINQKSLLLDLFKKYQFEYQEYVHEAIFTVEQGKDAQKNIPGAHSKNLFLKDKKGNFFLISLIEHKRLDIKAFAKLYGKGGLSFANEQALYEKLQLLPGSVTPYALFQESAKGVRFILDKEFLSYDSVNFHPLINQATINMPLRFFLQFFDYIGHPPTILELPLLLNE